jgi:hypothetical protein
MTNEPNNDASNNNNKNSNCQLLRILDRVLEQASLSTSNNNSINMFPPTLVVHLVWTVWQQFPYLIHATGIVARQGPEALRQLWWKTTTSTNDKMQIGKNDNNNDGAVPMEEDESDNDDNDNNNDSMRAHAKSNNVVITVTAAEAARPHHCVSRNKIF